ncbi:MAG: hypothetical protein ND866_02990, partial [Pyrinomonadaceae bacterium]|nr:hypothetical protein [Pyrinomonadaceae bacterium]
AAPFNLSLEFSERWWKSGWGIGAQETWLLDYDLRAKRWKPNLLDRRFHHISFPCLNASIAGSISSSIVFLRLSTSPTIPSTFHHKSECSCQKLKSIDSSPEP